MTFIRIPKKIPTESNSMPSEGSIATAPISAVLGPIQQLDAANNNSSNDGSETPQSLGMDQLGTKGLDGLAVLPDEVVLDDSGLPIETAQDEEFVGATTEEPGDLPGIVDEEPLDLDEDDDPGRAVELTEDFIADDFVERFGARIRFDHTNRRWYGWNGVYWVKDETGAVFDMARRHCRDLRRDDKRMASRRAVEGVEIMARTDPRVRVTSDIWDRDAYVLGTPDGYVDLLAGELLRSDPRLMVSRTTSVAPAQAGTPSPHFTAFLDQATAGDAALRRFMQQFFGYCLTGATNESRSSCSFMDPAAMARASCRRSWPKSWGTTPGPRRWTRSPLRGTSATSRRSRCSTALASSGCPRRKRARSGPKPASISSPAAIRSRPTNYMRQDLFTFVPKFKLMVVGNHKPQLGAVNDAARRRFLIVPFVYKPEKPDKALGAKLREEYPAILRWMIDGCLDWQKNSLVLPDVVKQATSDYFEDEDIFGRWIAEKCECGSGVKGKAAALYESWREFALANGEEPGSSVAFAETLGNRGFKKIKSDGVKYLGIAPLSMTTLNFKCDL